MLVDGRDVDPDAAAATSAGVACRVYRTAAGERQAPPEEWIRQALERASG